ncbi:MAG: FG-GAP repeat protein [Chitinophagales bacterium]
MVPIGGNSYFRSIKPEINNYFGISVDISRMGIIVGALWEDDTPVKMKEAHIFLIMMAVIGMKQPF